MFAYKVKTNGTSPVVVVVVVVVVLTISCDLHIRRRGVNVDWSSLRTTVPAFTDSVVTVSFKDFFYI